jgi:anaerobic selenocysteine-containing dehydrogenase
METAYRTCPFCEATCGLEVSFEGDEVSKVRPDSEDVFSKGFICPKGVNLKALHEDPDRLRSPMRRMPDGSFEECTWEEAFAEIDERWKEIAADGDRNAAAVYLGNPNAHSHSALLYGRAFMKGLGTQNIFTASSVDQLPKQVSTGLMFGGSLTIPIPDVDRTSHFLILGADPAVSNGSLMTAPDMRGRIRAIRERGGKVVVVDPRRSRTAEEATEHHFIRPGTDALLLAAMANVILEEGLDDPGEHLVPHLSGLESLPALVAPFTPEIAAGACGIDAGTIRTMARELAAAPSAAVYGRIGTTTQAFGALTSWLVDVLNIITGNLDREGGAMFPLPAASVPSSDGKAAVKLHRWSSRVSGRGEALGELPVNCLTEEIETPGEGQVRALFTLAGNPVLSIPNGDRLDKALESLDLMVSVDIYLNETTRHAHVILPSPSPLEKSQYDLAFYSLSVRNVANYSPAVLPLPDGAMEEWEILLRLTAIAAGAGPEADIGMIDDFIGLEIAKMYTLVEGTKVSGRDPAEVLAATGPESGPERLLDLMIRSGPWGDGFGDDPEGLSLARLEENPHGIDLGPLTPRIPEILGTESGMIEAVPPEMASELKRLQAETASRNGGPGLVLVGRRQLRSNNSWMHNLPGLVSGPEGCTVFVNPEDAERCGVADGDAAVLSSSSGRIELTAVVTDAIMPGVVSVPHGWGHDFKDTRLSVAREHAGANVNELGDSGLMEPLSGTAVLNGIPVELSAA